MISTLGGGVGRITNHILRHLLTKKGIELNLYLIDKRLKYQLGKRRNFTLHRMYTRGSPILSKGIALLRMNLKNPDVELLHSNYVTYASFIKRYSGKMILTMHGPPRPELESSIADKLAYMMEQCSLKLMPNDVKIITISEFSKQILKERYDIESEVVYNGIDCNYFTPIDDKEELKHKLGFKHKKIVLFVGRFHILKDPLTLISAYLELKKRIPNAVLVMVGNGPLKSQIMQFVNTEKSGITIIDNISEVNLLSLYQCSDLFVLPSVGEPFGLVLAEAMACGCPCIANTSGASPELIGTDELLVQPRNPHELAEKMQYILESEETSARVSRYLINRVNSLFTYEKMGDTYYSYYKKMLN